MQKPELIETGSFPISDIGVSSRLRDVTEASVESLMRSIEEVGLQQPIVLRKLEGKTRAEERFVLLAGGHRLEACKRLGWDAIPSQIYACTDEYADLMEVDDNLIRRDLSPLEMAIFMGKRKAVYERIHPLSKKGAKGNAASRGALTANLAVSGFAVATAEQLGKPLRTVERLVRIGTSLSEKQLKALKSAPRRVQLQDLELMAKTTDAKDRDVIVRGLASGEAKSAKDALSRHRGNPSATISPEDQKYLRLIDAFKRCPKARQRRFVSEHLEELQALIWEVSGK
ncbi:MAG: ParB/RepB/Spo0J family partition protein [Paracoccaceae bacterium]